MFVSSRKHFWIFGLLVFLLLAGCAANPDSALVSPRAPSGSNFEKAVPANYYATIDGATPATLRSSLHAIIDDHTRIPYTSTATDTWNVLEAADEDPNNSGRVLDIYLNASYQKWGAGNTDYNREHSWAKSYGFPNDVSTNYPYTDCHHLFISNDSYNSARNNKPYGTAGGTGTEYVTEVNNGVGGGSGTYPGWSNWANPTYWETWWDRRGDVARALFYMDVRYEGGTHGVTGAAEPDLILTDNLTLITNSNTGANESVAYMGLLSVLLQWSQDDPVDSKEILHNDVVYNFQGNRNPFVDHPEWISCVFGVDCGTGGDTTPPAAPTGLLATVGSGSVDLNWNDNGESDLAGYSVYRGTATGGPFNLVNGSLVGASQYTDTGVTNGTTYTYVVTASDASSNESGVSAEASATPAGGGGSVVWINEFHYDNDGTDTGEFVEIAGTAGTSLAGWTVVAYNGNGGAVYSTLNLGGSLPDQQGGFGTLGFNLAGLQNGSPDGLALVDGTGATVEFLSYEGSFAAVGGAANGIASTDVGVSETSTSPVGWSLQKAGTGTTSADFTWQPAQMNTAGAVNTGQSLGGGTPVNQAPTAIANGPYSGEAGQSVSFSSAGSTDPDGNIATWSWTFGDGGTSTQANPSHSYALPGSYAVTLTVTDNQGAEDTDNTGATIVDTTAPSAPAGLTAVAGNGSVDLAWSGNSESDLAGYTVARGTSAGGPFTALNGTLLGVSAFADNTVSNGTTYYYVVTASDLTGNKSGNSAVASALPTAPGGGAPAVWINEFHYDNTGTDRDEFVEVAGIAGTVLTGWTVVAYNGTNGAPYLTINLSGTLANQQGGFGTRSINQTGLQNGSPDGLALVDAAGTVIQFLSYEGGFTATSGPAAGLASTDIGVNEPTTTPRKYSLQLGGTGSQYSDFTWQSPLAKSNGLLNKNQTFSGP
jgi:endonuclease I/PKD repeat protein